MLPLGLNRRLGLSLGRRLPNQLLPPTYVGLQDLFVGMFLMLNIVDQGLPNGFGSVLKHMVQPQLIACERTSCNRDYGGAIVCPGQCNSASKSGCQPLLAHGFGNGIWLVYRTHSAFLPPILRLL